MDPQSTHPHTFAIPFLGCLWFAATWLPAQEPPPAAKTTVVEGRVVDLRSEGIPAAKVWVTTWSAPDTVLARTVADGEGYFKLGKVPQQDNLQVRANSDGYCVGVERSGGGATIVSLQSAATVKGVLLDRDGKPVAKTVVRAVVDGRILDYVESHATTGDDGRFELRNVPLAPNYVGAWVPGAGLAEQLLHVAGDCEVTLRPSSDATTTLTVVVDGVPADTIGSVGLSLLPYRGGGLTFLPPPYERPMFTKNELRLEPVPDCEYRVSPSAKGWVFAPRQIRVEAKKGPHTLRFTATAAGATSLACPVVVRGPDGKPVADVAFVMRASNGGLQARATTDADGKLTMLSPLGVGTKAVLYSVDDRWVTDQTKEAGPGGVDRRDLNEHEFVVDPSTTLEVRLAPASSVRGKLQLADGRPAAYVRLELQERDAKRTPEWMAMAFATTDRDGNYRFARLHHLDDAVRVCAESAAGAWASEPLDLSKVGTTLEVAVAKLTPPAIVDGVLRDGEQRPVGGMRVWLRDWDMAKREQRSGSVVETITDRAGRYRFVGVPPGGAWLQIVPAGQSVTWNKAVEPFLVEPGTTYTNDLQLPEK